MSGSLFPLTTRAMGIAGAAEWGCVMASQAVFSLAPGEKEVTAWDYQTRILPRRRPDKTDSLEGEFGGPLLSHVAAGCLG